MIFIQNINTWMFFQPKFTSLLNSDVSFTIHMYWKVLFRTLESIVWRSGKVWEVFWTTLGSIDIDTKYLRIPCLLLVRRQQTNIKQDNIRSNDTVCFVWKINCEQINAIPFIIIDISNSNWFVSTPDRFNLWGSFGMMFQ